MVQARRRCCARLHAPFAASSIRSGSAFPHRRRAPPPTRADPEIQAMSLLRIEATPPQNGVQRIAVEGSLDTSSHADLDRVVDPLLEDEEVRSVVLDLGNLNYINPAGIRS